MNKYIGMMEADFSLLEKGVTHTKKVEMNQPWGVGLELKVSEWTHFLIDGQQVWIDRSMFCLYI